MLSSVIEQSDLDYLATVNMSTNHSVGTKITYNNSYTFNSINDAVIVSGAILKDGVGFSTVVSQTDTTIVLKSGTSNATSWEFETTGGEPEPDPERIINQNDLDYFVVNEVTVLINGSPAKLGDDLRSAEIVATVNSGFIFEENENFISCWDYVLDPFGDLVLEVVNKPFTLDVDKKIATIQNEDLLYIDFIFSTKVYVEPFNTITNDDLQGFIDNHVSVSIDGFPAVVGSDISNSFFTVVVGAGYKFTDGSATATYEYWGYNEFGDYVLLEQTDDFTFSADYKNATLETKNYNYVNISLVTIPDDTPVVSGSNSIYLINNSILSDVNENRWVVSGTSDTPLDYGVYILNLIEFPFNIPDGVLDDPKNIKLADRDTTVSAVTLNDDVFEVDLGVINVVGVEGNLLDYSDKIAMLHLPYSQPIELDLNYVIDETISIKYLVSVYTGEATINISSSKLGGVVSSTTSKIGVNIPYISNATLTTINNDNIDLGGNNGVKRPYIEIIETDKILADGFYTIPVIDESVLTGQTGFIRVEEINLQSKASKQNKELLIGLLKEGVIIND